MGGGPPPLVGIAAMCSFISRDDVEQRRTAALSSARWPMLCPGSNGATSAALSSSALFCAARPCGVSVTLPLDVVVVVSSTTAAVTRVFSAFVSFSLLASLFSVLGTSIMRRQQSSSSSSLGTVSLGA